MRQTTPPRRPQTPPTGARTAARSGTGRKPRRSAPGGCGFFLCVAIVILLLAAVITWLIELPSRRAAAAASSTVSATSDASTDTTLPLDTATDAALSSVVGPVPQEDITAVQPITAQLVALPANGRVDMSYFDDALFIGDSLTQGFEVYASGIPNAKYAAYLGVGPKQFMEGTVTNLNGETVAAIDEILAAQPKKVYILLGTNSMASLTDEAFLKYYGDFLDYLIPQLPADTVYYIQGIPPVTAEKAAADENYALSRITSLNDSLAQMAYARGLNYLDLYTALADDTGAQNAAYSAGSDGIHLNGKGYDAWREYLITHTAYSSDNPYLLGSPLYVPPTA
jgi:lysophospholipase L1-like esterase